MAELAGAALAWLSATCVASPRVVLASDGAWVRPALRAASFALFAAAVGVVANGADLVTGAVVALLAWTSAASVTPLLAATSSLAWGSSIGFAIALASLAVLRMQW
ncbi:hypothetical protein [Sandaracinus amylolyticus]|uniref:Uncharacterized protein n=1 Tax=Sandaracinus amylolyticus TaxID=927083 RepID=A0A0F6W6H0_9BACT|nr:hypothetical protein [Sandaracinus amylolyticus]AKF08630.1 hypothetical protein DB32_005779 [Sandaracinus amylolyticus]